jgi:hypothetical protein
MPWPIAPGARLVADLVFVNIGPQAVVERCRFDRRAEMQLHLAPSRAHADGAEIGIVIAAQRHADGAGAQGQHQSHGTDDVIDQPAKAHRGELPFPLKLPARLRGQG